VGMTRKEFRIDRKRNGIDKKRKWEWHI